MNPKIALDREKIAQFCRRYHIQRLSVFGSALRDDFGPDSDIDVLFEFEPGHVPGFGLITVQDELSALFGGRRVDPLTPKSISLRIRQQVLSEAQVQYAEG